MKLNWFGKLAVFFAWGLALTLHAATFTDNFNSNHDYLSNGVAGTQWTGFTVGQVNPGIVTAWSANVVQTGTLTVTNTGGSLANGGDCPYLWTTVSGSVDFTNIVHVSGLSQINYNMAGLLVRNPASSSNWLYLALFCEYGIPIDVRDTVNLISAESTYTPAYYVETNSATWPSWLQIARVGGVLTCYVSTNGVNWEQAYHSTRSDLANNLQVGLFDSTFSANQCSVQFQNFSLSSVTPPVLSPVMSPGVTVQVDPATPLTNFWSSGEWNTNGNFDGWTTAQINGASVSGGLLTGTAGGSDPQVILSGLGGNGPDLDLAFYDYLDVRLQVPAGVGGGIQFYFGTTNNYFGTANSTTGFYPLRFATITNAPTDGAFHVYRVFFGPNVYWRGNLSDLRIDPLGGSAIAGQAFALDYVRVGDLVGDVYVAHYSAAVPAPGANDPVLGQPVQEMDSKHFRFCWNNWSVTNFPVFWTANMPHGTLRNLEEVWKNHVWRLGFPEPSHPVGSTPPYTGTKYKVNITTWNGGYWTGEDDNSNPWINITPDGLAVDPPTWVPPHEFTHACQESANTNGSQTVDGQFWENNADYGREQWLYDYPWETNNSGLDPNYANLSHFWIGYGNDYYLCWPFWLYLDENPDHLPGLGSSYGNFFTPKLWEFAKPGEYLWDTLARLSPGNSVQDIIGYVARRDVMWDYSHRAALTNAAATGDLERNQRQTFAELRQRPDDPTWWQAPLEFAPQQTGYKIHRLIPQGSGAGRVVSVNFHGLPDSSRGADWRASFVVVSDTGAVRYSSLFDSGTNSVTLATNENTVYLSVAGTPATFLAETTDETVEPFQSSPAKERFPYEMQITGATPGESTNGSTSGLVQVANGGGWRASTATVDATAYVGPNARVLGSAQVRGNARILDYAIVEGSAVVTSNAVVSGHALVRDTAVVKDFAKVRDYAMVVDNSTVANYARVLQHAEITAGSVICNWATVKGTASTWHDNNVSTEPQAWNDAVLDGDFSTAQSCSNGFQFGFVEYNPGPLNWITNRTAPRRLFADYEFASAHDSLAKDSPGVTDGYLQGSPTWYASDGQRVGFLAFNGMNQFVILDRSLSDLPEITIAAFVKWSGGAAGQPVWYFGTAATNCMFFTPNDGTGSAKFSITTGGITQTLAWTNPLPVGVWTHVAVSLSNGVTGRLYINGTNVVTGGITLTPDRLNAPNVNTAAQQNYLARGAGNSLPYFQGALDSVRVYTGPLTAAEISALVPPANFVGTGTLYVDLRAPNAASPALVTYSTWTNLGSSVGNFTQSGSPAYSPTVAATGIPGVQFDGSAAFYSSTNISLAGLTGAGPRTIEVWAYNPALALEETMVSLGDRSGLRKDCAFNFGTAPGWGAVTHYGDDVSWGSMPPSSSAWHHLVYTYDGATGVKIYVDGALWTTATLGGALVTPVGDPINIGCQRDTGGGGAPDMLFSGYINTVRVWGGVLTSNQVTANYLFGPCLPALPAAPAGLTGTPGNTQAILSWNASPGTASYNVKRLGSGASYITITNVTTTSYTDTGLVNGTTYDYVVSAVNAWGESLNSSPVSVMPTDLYGWWKFDATNGVTAADSGTGGNKGALMTGATWVSGVISNAVHLNGTTNGYVSFPAGLVRTLNSFSVSTWVKVDANPQCARVFDYGSGTGAYMFLSPDSGSNTVRYAITTNSSAGEQRIENRAVLSTGIWHHVAVTLSGSVGVLYIDGAAVGTNSSMTLHPSNLGSTTQNYIGKSQWADPNLTGSVDDFRIYSRALSAAEIAGLAALSTNTPYSTAPAALTASKSGMLTFRFYGVPNGTFVVQQTADLTQPWVTVSTNVAGPDGTWTYTVPAATNSQEYYRAKQP